MNLGRIEYNIFHIARVSIELTSPLSIGSGERDIQQDLPFVVDHNGIPTIPGSSLAGVLRSRWHHCYDRNYDRNESQHDAQEGAQRLFGHANHNGDDSRSLINVSWGILHDSQDCPHPPLVPKKNLDPLLANTMRQQIVRDHVRINHQGVVDQRGKYDRSAVMKGHRFTFEISMRGMKDQIKESTQEFHQLLGLLYDQYTRLGGGTRCGYGAFKVIRCLHRSFDLCQQEDFQAYLTYPSELHKSTDLLQTFHPDAAETASENEQVNRLNLKLVLQAEEHWLQGGGDVSLWADEQFDPKIVPYTERVIQWTQGKQGDQGAMSTVWQGDLVMTASAIKGALRHRCAYHVRRLQKKWVHQETTLTTEAQDPESLREIQLLFGYAKDKESDGQVGSVIVDDIRLQLPTDEEWTAYTTLFDHLSIDRFSGAPRHGHLFSDVAVHPSQLKQYQWSISLQRPHIKDKDEDVRAFQLACKALACTLRDLARGHLQLGAGTGRGYGYFTAQYVGWHGDQKLWQHFKLLDTLSS